MAAVTTVAELARATLLSPAFIELDAFRFGC